MKVTKWQRVVSLVLLAGVLMKLFDVPYGKEVFTAGFGGYFLLKLSKMFATRVRFWSMLHFVQLGLILVAIAALVFMYYDYAYSRVVFAIALLAEGLVALRIKVDALFGSQNVSNILQFVSKLLFAKRTRPPGEHREVGIQR